MRRSGAGACSVLSGMFGQMRSRFAEVTTWTFTTADVGTVSGIVKDEGGNPVSGATVTLKSAPISCLFMTAPVFSVESTLGTTLTIVTNFSGEYAFYDVAIGSYKLTIVKAGFGTVTENVKVTSDTVASGTATVDATLPVESGPDSTLLIVGTAAIVAVMALAAVLLVRKKQ